MHYYINLEGNNIGPMTKEQMMAYQVDPNTLVSKDGGAWAPLYTYPELMQEYQNHKNRQQAMATPGETDSKKTLCGILAILVGTLGIQYFVLGKTTAGILTIVISIVTCGAWGIITLIQGIMMLCMSDAEFKRKFVDTQSTFPLF